MNRRSFIGGLAALVSAAVLAKVAPAESAPAVQAVAPGLKRGDVFTIEGVYAINPKTNEETGRLAQFVVTSDVEDDWTSITFSPVMVAEGPRRTVSAHPRARAKVQMWSGRRGFFEWATQTRVDRGVREIEAFVARWAA